MKRILALLLCVGLIGMGGCHTTSRRVVGGAIIGAVVGGLVGAASDHHDRHRGDRGYRSRRGHGHRYGHYDHYYCD